MSSTIDNVVLDYEAIAAHSSSLLPIAQAVFWTLGLVELTWSAIW
jgi:hypothetical protein